MKTTAAVLAGRIIMGIGGDTNGLNLGYYVTEVAPKNVRGRALIFIQQFSSSFLNIAGSWISYGGFLDNLRVACYAYALPSQASRIFHKIRLTAGR